VTGWSDARLDGLRQQGDPAADAVATAWFARPTSADPADAVRQLVRHDVLPDEDRVPEVHAYLTDRPPLPAWVDPDAVRAGQRFFEARGAQIGAGLFMASLPAGYAGAKGAKVLFRTARLVTDPRRRVVETGQMLLHAMSVGGLEVGAPGWVDARRVRLMHAAVRHLVATAPGSGELPRWDAAAWGVPVNQEDLLGTLWTFSLTTLDVLRRLGERVPAADAEAYVHAWQVVGHLMGIDEALLPMGVDEARASFDAIRRRQYASSPEGRVLAEALVSLFTEMVPGHLLDGMVPTGIRHYLGDDVGDMLGVPPSNWTRRLFPLVAGEEAAHAVLEHAQDSGRMATWLGKLLWEAVLAVEGRGERAPFDMPDHLADRWGVRRRA
jgi:hypothetical protein